MRQAGHTYSEILKEIPVAKSTLSLWLRSVGLAKRQMQRLTKKRLEAGRRGGQSRRVAREQEISRAVQEGVREVGQLTERELWLIGVALYWAEGSKQHAHLPSIGIMFSNSDSRMAMVFLEWLRIMHIPKSEIYFELYIHRNRKAEINIFKSWWAQELGVEITRFDRVYFKKDKPKTNRTNIADLYHGLIRIKVRSSTLLNRRIAGWTEGVVASLGDRLMVGRLPLKQ